MRVYITADMEGVTGLVDADDVQPGGRDYEHGRAMMTADVNAAVIGALAGGATEVLVNDAHGPMRNILLDRLHPAARLVRGKPKPMGMAEGLDGGAAAVICVGYHARAGARGVLSHSFMGHEIEDMWLDGRPVGEIGLLHATAAALGAPVVMLTGDDAACAEMAEWAPAVLTVPVKYARDRFAAELRPARECRAAIESTARDAVAAVAAARGEPGTHSARAAAPGGAGGGGSLIGTMVREAVAAVAPGAGAAAGVGGEAGGPGDDRTLAVRWQSASVASCLLGIPGVASRDDRTVEVSGPMPALYRLLGVFLRVTTALTNQQPYC